MTIYEANTRHWQRGDLVIHDADAKRADMLMVVVGYTRDGLCKVRYLDNRTTRWGKILPNGLENLHDPKRFNIPTDGDETRKQHATHLLRLAYHAARTDAQRRTIETMTRTYLGIPAKEVA